MLSRAESSRRPSALGIGLAFTILLWAGCGPPAVAPSNQRLTVSLRTALSTQRTDWLELNAQEIESRRAAGEMGEEEYAAFSAIVAQARAGEWQAAEKEIVRLQKAQRPTQEQLDQLAQSAD